MTELTRQIQAILFAAGEPTSWSALVEATTHPEEDVRTALDELSEELKATGLRLEVHNDFWELVTAPEAAEAVKRHLIAGSNTDLSRAALETLSMIAYRGPISRSELDELRGVSSEAMLRNLLQRGLITQQGRSTEAGRPALYSVTQRFLQHVGLTTLAELPALDEAPSNEA